MFNKLSNAINFLAEQICELKKLKTDDDNRKSHSSFATKAQLDNLENKIMTKVQQFIADQNSQNDKIDAAVSGIEADVAFLKAKIDEIQNSPGELSPADQTALDALQNRVSATVAKVEALNSVTDSTPVAPAV